MSTNTQTFLRWMATRPVRWLQGEKGRRYFGTFALFADMLAEGARQVVRASIGSGPDVPTDALRLLSKERDLPWWPSESEAHYRGRINAGQHWAEHQERTSPRSFVTQGAHAGYTLAVVEPPAASLTFPDYKIEVSGYGALPCTPYTYGGTAPAYGTGWHYGTSLPSAVVQEVRSIATWCEPRRSRLVGFTCP